MKTKSILQQELEEYSEKVGEPDKFIFSVINANFQGERHSMLIDGEFSYKGIDKELSELEKIDLIDYFNMEQNERTD